MFNRRLKKSKPVTDKKISQGSSSPKKIDPKELLIAAVSSGDSDQVKKILKMNAQTNSQFGGQNLSIQKYSNIAKVDGANLLHIAARVGSAAIIKLLAPYANKLSQNEKDRAGFTPLHLATLQNHLDCVNALLEIGNVSVQEKLIDESNALHIAAYFGHDKILTALLAHGAKSIIDEKNAGKCTPLHLAVFHGHTETVKVLLKNHANPNILLPDKSSILHAAVYQGHTHLISLLIQNDFNINHKNDQGDSALDIAFNKRDFGIFITLIDSMQAKHKEIATTLALANANFDIRVQDRKGKTLLDYALGHPNSNILVPLLMAHCRNCYSLESLQLKTKLNSEQSKLLTGFLVIQYELALTDRKEEYDPRFWGFKGFSKKDKLAAAEALLVALETKAPIDPLHEGALKNGRLGRLFADVKNQVTFSKPQAPAPKH